MRYTDELHAALETALARYGTRAELARRTGIHEAIIGRYLARRHDTISETNAERLLAFLRTEGMMLGADSGPPAVVNTPELRSFIQDAIIERHRQYPELARACHMQPDTLRRLLKGDLAQWFPANLAKLLAELDLDPEAAPIPPAQRQLLHPAFADGGMPTRPCWVFTLTQAASIGDIHSPVEPETGWDCDVIPVAEARDCIAFRVQGDSMSPRILDGDVVICDRRASPVNRKPVVAKVQGRVVCKQYRRIGDLVFLESLNPNGQDYENLDPAELEWCLPVIKLERAI